MTECAAFNTLVKSLICNSIPIHFEGTAVGVIGISGNPQLVKPFGVLVTKITEIFLKEQRLNETLASKKRVLSYIITSLIFNNIKNPEGFEQVLHNFGIDTTLNFRVLSIKLSDNSLEQKLNTYFMNQSCPLTLYLYPSEYVVIMNTIQFNEFQNHLSAFTKQFEHTLILGIGSTASLYQVYRSYESAKIAGKYALIAKKPAFDIENISVEILLYSLPDNIKDLFMKKAGSLLTDKELIIIKTYFENNLSLKHTAATLYIHPNTLQYQLNKIHEKTGYNPRNYQDSVMLYPLKGLPGYKFLACEIPALLLCSLKN